MINFCSQKKLIVRLTYEELKFYLNVTCTLVPTQSNHKLNTVKLNNYKSLKECLMGRNDVIWQ